MRRAAVLAVAAVLGLAGAAQAQDYPHSAFGQAVADSRVAYIDAGVDAALTLTQIDTAQAPGCASAFLSYAEGAERSLEAIEDFVLLERMIVDPAARDALRAYFQTRAARADSWITLSALPVQEACANAPSFQVDFERLDSRYRALLAVMQGEAP